MLYYRNALPRVKILRFILHCPLAQDCELKKKWFIKSNSWQNTTKQNEDTNVYINNRKSTTEREVARRGRGDMGREDTWKH